MPGKNAIRAQLALVLTLSLLATVAINSVVGASLLQRAQRRESEETLRAASALLEARTEACGPACQGQPLESSDALTVTSSLDSSAPQLSPGPSALRRRSGAVSLLVSYSLLSALLGLVLGYLLVNRLIARPLDRLAAAAERIGRLELDDPLSGGAETLGRLGISFERMASSLKEERARLAGKISELEQVNRQLAEARDSLVRSEKLATVGRLAAGVAHEVGNPLGAIVGYLELAKSRAQGEELTDYLARIDREIGRIDRTIRELLDFSRPADSQAPEPVSLAEAVDSAVRLAKVQKRLKHVAFDIELPQGARVMAESHRLSQVLVNVLLNAGDAMKGEGTIVIRARQAGAPGDRLGPGVELSLADTGPGIAPENLPRIFDPFFTTKDPGEGTGLGLSICHRLMELFGGEIRAANRPEGGAEFTLVFRAALPPPPTSS